MPHRKIKKHIGKVLKAERLKLKLSAEDVGCLCNVSRSRVYQWESGRYVFPKNIPMLARALGIPPKILEAENLSKKGR